MISLALALLLAVPAATSNAPLPNPAELKVRTLASLQKSQLALERYSCTVHGFYDELNDDGSIKKHSTRKSDRFYVNGIQIDHVIARNGKDLSGSEARKEQEKTDEEVKKYSDPREVEKKKDKRERQTEMFLRAQHLTNGRREGRWGYDTIAFDLSGDPKFHPRNLEERLAHAMTGRIWIDEETGNPVELQIRTERDVRIGGGLLATLHKGFELKFFEHRQADGTWLEKSAEGNGDARAALFFHPKFRFKEDVESCRLFSVDSKDLGHEKP